MGFILKPYFLLLCLLSFNVVHSAWASSVEPIWDGESLKAQSLEQVLAQIPRGAVVVIGEQHGEASMQAGQMRILAGLRKSQGSLNVGMEFLSWPHQALVEDYLLGRKSEADFLRDIAWGGFSFDLYRSQILFSVPSLGEMTYALNAPRELTSYISRQGLKSLPENLSRLMPPQFNRGNQGYFERFSQVMSGHVPADKIENYFLAQSVWDETMAWKALETPQDKTLVIIVGRFHVEYGGGLPDRLLSRGNRPVYTFLQVGIKGWAEQEIVDELAPHADYGKKADWLLLYNGVE